MIQWILNVQRSVAHVSPTTFNLNQPKHQEIWIRVLHTGQNTSRILNRALNLLREVFPRLA